jgi:hypothetical protein
MYISIVFIYIHKLYIYVYILYIYVYIYILNACMILFNLQQCTYAWLGLTGIATDDPPPPIPTPNIDHLDHLIFTTKEIPMRCP